MSVTLLTFEETFERVEMVLRLEESKVSLSWGADGGADSSTGEQGFS